jgi:hypothetical protein
MNWSSGPVEGRVNHIMIERQMFGRAACLSSASASCSLPSAIRSRAVHEIRAGSDDLRVRHPVLQRLFIKASSSGDSGDLV